MKRLLVSAAIILSTGVALANTTVVVQPKPTQPPTVIMPPSDPNAGDASAYTLPQDGLTSSADNAELGRAHQEQIEIEKRLHPAEPPAPRPDQNSY
jgi:hypothetical protein